MRRVHFYIDAFNFWHRLKDHRRLGGKDYRWLDYAEVCRGVLRRDKQLFEGGEAGRVVLFTTQPADWWSKERRARHQMLLRALAQTGTEVVDSGYFKKAGKRPREVRTDANIVARMVGDAARDAARGDFGLYMVVSGDNDFAPALEEVRKFGHAAGVVLPPFASGKNRRDDKLEDAASQNKAGAALIVRMRFQHLDGCGLPQIPGRDGEGRITMPAVYKIF